MLALVKLALRISSTTFDTQLNMLIAAAQTDLGIAGVELPTTLDEICQQAIITYVRMHFGQPDDYERLKASYDEQKAQLSMSDGYTDWLNDDEEE